VRQVWIAVPFDVAMSALAQGLFQSRAMRPTRGLAALSHRVRFRTPPTTLVSRRALFAPAARSACRLGQFQRRSPAIGQTASDPSSTHPAVLTGHAAP
jgi:hypothetical protein